MSIFGHTWALLFKFQREMLFQNVISATKCCLSASMMQYASWLSINGECSACLCSSTWMTGFLLLAPRSEPFRTVQLCAGIWVFGLLILVLDWTSFTWDIAKFHLFIIDNILKAEALVAKLSGASSHVTIRWVAQLAGLLVSFYHHKVVHYLHTKSTLPYEALLHLMVLSLLEMISFLGPAYILMNKCLVKLN